MRSAAMALTGRFWFRKTWTGKLVLMVEVERRRWFGRGANVTRWRDAKLLDLAEPSMRALLTVEQSRRAAHAAASPRSPAPSVVAPGPAVTRKREPQDT